MGQPLARDYDLLIFDLDGVIYLGEEPVAGAVAAVRAAVDGGTEVAYLTNNASRRREEVARLLGRLGIPARADQVITSAQGTAVVLAQRLPAGAPVLVVGSAALGDELAAAGLSPVDSAAAAPVAVAQGFGPRVGWAELAEACVAVRAGAIWVATNTDTTVPSPRGMLPGNGSLVAALSTALGGRTPDLVVGKPGATLFELVTRIRGARRPLVIGDRLETDVAGANAAGLDSLLVLTGVATAADVVRAVPPQRPTFVAADLGALAEAAQRSRVPGWAGAGPVRCGRWLANRSGEALVVSADPAQEGGPDPVDAVRALAAAAWASPGWTAVRLEGPAARRTLGRLDLDIGPR